MTRVVHHRRSVCCGVAALLIAAVSCSIVAASASAAERRAAPRYGAYNPEHETVDLFEAAAAGAIEAKLYVTPDKTGRVVIENKTDAPLNVALPEAFAGQPVLAQFGGGGFGGGGLGGGGL
ncbi:MAG: hypothetical protein KDA63_11085, partial [Planctomycetales bacterium]|nr:hypothetical protein [Planctomycetales bacterium]